MPVTKEQVAQALRRKGYQGALPQIEQGQSQPQGGGVRELLSGLMGRLPSAVATATGTKIQESPETNLENEFAKTYGNEAIKKSFETEEERLINRAKAIEAAKSTGNRALYDSLVGLQKPIGKTTDTSSPSTGQPRQLTAPEIDQFTGKLSTRGEQQKMENELMQKRLEEEQKPLSGETATRLAGAQQAKGNITSILKQLKLSPTGNMSESGKPEYQSGFGTRQRIVDKVQQDAAGTTGLVFGQNVPIISDALRLPQVFADQDARQLQNDYETLAENLLRARTGATAPEPELVREFARTLNRLGDDPTTVANRLLTNQDLLDEIIFSIKPSLRGQANQQQPQNSNGPQVGGSFNGEQVLSVERVDG